MNDQQAYEMGRRWVAAGFVPTRGSKDYLGRILLSGTFTPGLFMDVWNSIIGRDGANEFVPDPRDPGNKGHAIAQLRERLKDPFVCLVFRFAGAEWWVDTSTHDGLVKGETEEGAITAALEATKP